MTNEFLKVLVKAFEAGREYAKYSEIPENLQDAIEDAFLSDFDIVAILTNMGIAEI